MYTKMNLETFTENIWMQAKAQMHFIVRRRKYLNLLVHWFPSDAEPAHVSLWAASVISCLFISTGDSHNCGVVASRVLTVTILGEFPKHSSHAAWDGTIATGAHQIALPLPDFGLSQWTSSSSSSSVSVEVLTVHARVLLSTKSGAMVMPSISSRCMPPSQKVVSWTMIPFFLKSTDVHRHWEMGFWQFFFSLLVASASSLVACLFWYPQQFLQLEWSNVASALSFSSPELIHHSHPSCWWWNTFGP